MGEADRKSPAESAALFLFIERDNFHPGDGAKKLEDGRAALGSTGVAGSVVGDAGLVVPWPRGQAETMNQIITEFPGAAPDLFDFRQVLLMLKFKTRAMKHHGRAGARGDDNGFLPGEDLGGVAHDLTGGVPLAAVEGGLTAAGLILGKNNFAAHVFENLDSCTSHIIKKGVAEASSHKLHSLAFRPGGEIDHQATGSGYEQIIKMGEEPSYRVLSASTALPRRKCYNLE